jgi:hypothetical protein
MKYKHIDAMLHNFGHSFVSLMNYVDDQYVIDILEDLVRHSSGHEVEINFSSGRVLPPSEYPEAFDKSIFYAADWLPKHIANHGLDPGCLSEVRLRYRLTSEGREVIVSATDDRGK